MQTLYSAIKALLKNNQPISLPDVFASLEIVNKSQGEDLLRATVERLCKERNLNGQKWARTIKGEAYRVLDTPELDQYWANQAVHRASRARMVRFYDAETEVLTSGNKRQKIGTGTEPESSSTDSNGDDYSSSSNIASRNNNIVSSSRSSDSSSTNNDSNNALRATNEEMVQTWSEFMTTADFADSHYYRLERYGIIQCGHFIQKSADIPNHLYDSLMLEKETDPFPTSVFASYLKKVTRSVLYGTADCAALIFDKGNVVGPFDNDAFHFLSRLLFHLSEQAHNKHLPSPLMESEAIYSYSMLWPLLQNSARALPGLICDFKVGETLLKALDFKGVPNYNADGVVFLKDSGLELLVLEVSGALGTRNRHRHVLDHIKGAFGCHAMIRSILNKYPDADTKLLEDVSVSFIHSSAKDNFIRLWVMRPRCGGDILSFERVAKCNVSMDRQNSKGILEIIKFFWLVKNTLSNSQKAVAALMESSNGNAYDIDTSSKPRTSLPDMLKPTPIKPEHNFMCDGIVDLDPVSILL